MAPLLISALVGIGVKIASDFVMSGAKQLFKSGSGAPTSFAATLDKAKGAAASATEGNTPKAISLETGVDRAALMAHWERGWSVLFAALAALTPDVLLKDVYIRGHRHSVIQALHRAFGHQSQHAGQIVFLAKHLRSGKWKTLSMARRRTQE